MLWFSITVLACGCVLHLIIIGLVLGGCDII